MGLNYILKDKTPVEESDLLTWAKAFEHSRHVAKDKIGDVLVSTVFLGIDHSFNGGKPILFETMVFGGPLDSAQERYHSWDEAEQGHKEMVERVKQTASV